MQEHEIRIRIGPDLVRWVLVCFLLALIAPDLDSESMTMTTYYPAPSGVYKRLTTTGPGNTILARDGGNVGIGTTNPRVPLDVTNTQIVGLRYIKTGSQDARIQVGDPTQTWSMASGWSGGGAGDFNIIQEGVSGNRIYISHTSGNVGIGTSNPQATLDVAGGIRPGNNAAVTICGASQAGTLRYNQLGSGSIEYCDNTGTWRPTGGSVRVATGSHSRGGCGTQSWSTNVGFTVDGALAAPYSDRWTGGWHGAYTYISWAGNVVTATLAINGSSCDGETVNWIAVGH